MAIDADEAGFLSRWSRRKALVRQGAVPTTPTAPGAPATAPPESTRPSTPQAAAASTPVVEMEAQPPAVTTEPAPTLADVGLLTRDSDYTRFVARGVQPEVRNAALGKLFSDPHFNVMDGLDTYIDDYGKPDPLPAGMLRQMAQSKMLGLFEAEEDEPMALPATPAQAEAAAPTPPDPPANENTDLQLQPDDDLGCAGPAPGAGEDAGRAR